MTTSTVYTALKSTWAAGVRWLGQWARLAACHPLRRPADLSIDSWQAQAGTEDARKARSVCMTCPVRPECLQHSLQAAEPVGIWGGVDEEQRREMLRARRRTRSA